MRKASLLWTILLTIFAILAIVIFLTGCGKTEQKPDKVQHRMVLLDSTMYHFIYYDRETGVEYLFGTQCVTPMYNADGTLKLHEGTILEESK